MKEEINDFALELIGPGLDHLMGSELLERIPGFGSALKVMQAVGTIPNFLFAKKVIRFLRGTESLSHQTRADFYLELSANPERSKAAGEALMFAIERADSAQKAAIMGRLFCHYIMRKFELLEFRRLLHAVNAGFLHDLLAFSTWAVTGIAPSNFEPTSLEGTGLVEPVARNLNSSNPTRLKYSKTPLGQCYAECTLGYKPEETGAESNAV